MTTTSAGTPVRLLVLAGDGIGPEITAATLRVLDAAADRFDLALTYDHHDIGLAALETELGGALRGARGLISDNRAEVAEATRRLRRTMWQAEMALRKIRANPAYLLFGDAEPDLEAGPVDHSALWRSGRARPYEQRDERGGGK